MTRMDDDDGVKKIAAAAAAAAGCYGGCGYDDVETKVVQRIVDVNYHRYHHY